jgi:hypothetical protein
MASINEDAIVLDWEEMLKKAPFPVAENLIEIRVEVGHPLSGTTIDNQSKGVQNESGDLTIVDQLVSVSACEEFTAVIQGLSREVVEDAIALSDTQPRRLQLSQWHEQFTAELETSIPDSEVTTEGFVFTVGQKLKGWRGTVTGKIAQVIETFGDWCETTLGYVTAEEVQSGAWTLV